MDQRDSKKWTDAEIALVERKWNHDGVSASVIARQVGRTRNAVCGLINRHSDRFKPRASAAMLLRNDKRRQQAAGERDNFWTTDEIDSLKTFWRAGLVVPEIAERLGRTNQAVSRYIDRHRDDFPRRYKTGESVVSRVMMRAPVRAQTPLAIPVTRIDSRDRSAPPSAPTSPEPVTFLDVSDRQCRFPLWGAEENPGAEGLCCGAAIDFGAVYCGFHRVKTTSVPRMAVAR